MVGKGRAGGEPDEVQGSTGNKGAFGSVAVRAWLAVLVSAALICAQLGCATTVGRLDGEYPTPVGPARSECESRDWLVVAPTRAEVVEEGDKKPTIRDDGAGLYRVGGTFPESIPGLESEIGQRSRLFALHAERVRRHDTKRIVAAGLGAAGVIVLGIGAALFISAFDSHTDPVTGTESNQVNGGRAIVAGITVAGGLGLGIAGIAVSPSQAERSRAAAYRYVFLPPDESRDEVVGIAAEHNEAVRERCRETPNP